MSRADVVVAALAEVGQPTPEAMSKYFSSAFGKPTPVTHGMAWCGIFALYCLHAAQLAPDVVWHVGKGFLLQPPHPLPIVKVPEPGDIGYQASPFQHHFVVESVDGALVHSVDGNQPDVRRKTRAMGSALTFFSIEPLLRLAGASDALPSPGVQLRRWSSPAEVQHAVNNLIMQHLLDNAPGLLTVDGDIGSKSTAAIKWAQGILHIPITGFADAATCAALGLS